MLGPWQPMEFTSVNLIEIIERVMQILQGEFVDNLQWSRDYDPSLPDVHGNQDQLIQAILNVARNACQALQGTEELALLSKRGWCANSPSVPYVTSRPCISALSITDPACQKT